MRILNLPLLEKFKQHHADIRGQLDAWRDEVGRESWQTPQDIKQRYKSADFLSDNRVIFNIKGNSYRLVVQVRYRGWASCHRMGGNPLRVQQEKVLDYLNATNARLGGQR